MARSGRRSREARGSVTGRTAIASLRRRRASGEASRRRGERVLRDRSAALLVRGRDVLVVGRGLEASRSGRRRGTGPVEHGSRGAGGGHGRLLEELRREGLRSRLDTVLAGLCGESTLSSITMALALAILLVGVLDANLFVHKVLSIHVGDSVVGGFERRERDEAVTLGEVVLVASDLGKITLDFVRWNI